MSMVSNKLFTLVFVRNNGKILLGNKKRGFGMGRWNGFGGKVEKGETIEEGAVRELQEECGLETSLSNLNKVGLLMFKFTGEPQTLEVHVFTTTQYTGDIQETSEMRPEWYDLDNIPFQNMWPDDTYWFPLMLQNKMFRGDFFFKDMDTILKQTIKEVDQF